jgi:hypothetical protein
MKEQGQLRGQHRIKLASWNGLVIRMIRPWIVRFGPAKRPRPQDLETLKDQEASNAGPSFLSC